MATSWDAILHNAARALGDAAGVAVSEDDLTAPPDPKLGDISFGCFKLAKIKGKNPAEVAKELVGKLGTGDHSIESASAAGPYVNLTLRGGDLVNRIVKDVETQKEDFGRAEARKERLMIEYAQPNTHKEIHVGHLRNLVLGAALVRLLKNDGWDAVVSSYHGDVGAHVAKCLWFLARERAPKQKKKRVDWVEALLDGIPKEERTGKYLGSLYAQATKALDENPSFKDEISDVQRKLEGGDPDWKRLWQETRRWSIDEMDAIFQDLGLTFDRRYYESEVVDEGQKIVDELLKEQVATESQGAVIVDLEDKKLGVFLIRKSDGTSLYATKDLALAKLKLKEYPGVARSLIVVDSRQSLYFKQLFATLAMMGFTESFEFVGYEFVTLKSGAMSSREGNVVTWQDFRDEVLAFATGETQKRHADWNEGRVTHTAWCLMMGGIRFGMLRQDSDKIFTFDVEQALSFDGATGPYVQYAATRLGSILRKADWTPEKGLRAGDPSVLGEPAEKRLALCTAHFPHVAARAARELRPAILAQWCLDMATRTNEFYRDVNVLDADDGLRRARLRLVASARAVLIRSLNLLGVPVPEEM